MSPKDILKQAIEVGAFDGTEPKEYGRYAASFDYAKGTIAIANSGGWWIMKLADLKAIAEGRIPE